MMFESALYVVFILLALYLAFWRKLGEPLWKKFLEQNRKEVQSLQKSLDEKILAKEIHDLEVSLGLIPGPKWAISKNNSGHWVIYYGDRKIAARYSFNAARKEFIRLSSSEQRTPALDRFPDAITPSMRKWIPGDNSPGPR